MGSYCPGSVGADLKARAEGPMEGGDAWVVACGWCCWSLDWMSFTHLFTIADGFQPLCTGRWRIMLAMVKGLMKADLPPRQATVGGRQLMWADAGSSVDDVAFGVMLELLVGVMQMGGAPAAVGS
ncbi:hypothetical protein ACLOJK_004412 [Asimina triloba]